MNIFIWHLHGSWMTAFVQGGHRYLVPRLPERGPWGLGRAQSWEWPASVVEVTPERAAAEALDVVILQRPQELEALAECWLGGRRPGMDLPAIYLEHNAPQGQVNQLQHPAANRPELTLVHVTHFNRLFWDSGSTPVRVIQHGVIDPGHRYTGELVRGAAVINEPERRGRVVGFDLLGELGGDVPIDLYGMGTPNNLPQAALHEEMARHRFYVHPYRWTSLGLSLIEAMQLGMPVVALATTEAPDAIPAGAGIVSNRPEVLREGICLLTRDPRAAREMGWTARRGALARYSLERFLDDWDRLLEEVAA